MLGGQPDPSDPWIGKVMSERYRVVNIIGEGGMGRVYLAEQQMGRITRKVAVKTLHPDLAADPLIAKRFNREAETVIRLGHPNTITFHDFGQTEDGTLFIVMEYINGESLAQVLKQGPMAPKRIDNILDQICSSLHEAHEMGIIHRDLKPDNIILTQRVSQSDFIKVLDFGIAKRTELDADSLKMTRAGVVLGTPPYMSPEQFAGQPLDRRSDIYSLGIVTYEMLTGRLPFEARTPWEWATKHLSAQPLPFDHCSTAPIPERCCLAVHRAISKNVDDRPPTALAFVEEFRGRTRPPPPADASLVQAQTDEAGSTTASGALPNTQRVHTTHRSLRTRWAWWQLAFIACMAAIALVFVLAVLGLYLGVIPH
jgi:serine/threonine-protein kinase